MYTMRTLPTYLLLLIMVIGASLSGQTSLQPGDIGFYLFNMESNNTDAFGLVLLTDVAAGTTIFITDDEYRNGALDGQDGRIQLTFTNAFSCGTEILFDDIDPETANYVFQASVGGSTAGLSTTNLVEMQFSTAGDALLIYQDASATTNTPGQFIAALQNTGEGFGGNMTGSTDLPPGLTLGASAMAMRANDAGAEFDNIRYDCSFTNGAPEILAAALFNRDNWEGDDAAAYPEEGCSGGFTCGDGCADPIIRTVNASSPDNCPGSNFTIAIDGALNDGIEWRLHAGSCDGTVLTTGTGNTITQVFNTSGTYAVTALDCNWQTVCGTFEVALNGVIAEIVAEEINVPEGTSSTPITATPPAAGQTGVWTIVTDPDGNGVIANVTEANTTFTGSPGGTYVLRYTLSGNGCADTFDEVTINFFAPATLSLGQLLFTGYNSLPDDDFGMIVQTDEIAAGTVIGITDRGWTGTGFRTQEETVAIFEITNALSCGDQLHFLPNGTIINVGNNDQVGLLVSGIYPAINSLGDQLFAFSGSTPPTGADQSAFVCAIQMNCHDCSADTWDGGATNNRTSAKPSVFTGSTANFYGGDNPTHNAIYDCSGTTQGPPTTLSPLLTDPANWLFRDALAYDLSASCEFSCCPSAVIENLSVTEFEIVADSLYQFEILDELPEGAFWGWGLGDCASNSTPSSSGPIFNYTSQEGVDSVTFFVRAYWEDTSNTCPLPCAEIVGRRKICPTATIDSVRTFGGGIVSDSTYTFEVFGELPDNAQWAWGEGDCATGVATEFGAVPSVYLVGAEGLDSVTIFVRAEFTDGTEGCPLPCFEETSFRDTTTSVFTPDRPSIDMTLFPNPAVNRLQVRLPDHVARSSGLQWRIMDAVGKTANVPVSRTLTGLEANITLLPAGVYFLRVFDPESGEIGIDSFVVKR